MEKSKTAFKLMASALTQKLSFFMGYYLCG